MLSKPARSSRSAAATSPGKLRTGKQLDALQFTLTAEARFGHYSEIVVLIQACHFQATGINHCMHAFDRVCLISLVVDELIDEHTCLNA